MKVLMISSACGGSGKTTVAVRLAEALATCRVRAGVVDVSPYPTSSMIVHSNEVKVVPARSATTTVAARCVLKPYEGQWDLAILDTGRLDDNAITPFMPLCTAMMLVTRPDHFALRAFKGISEALEKRRADNPSMEFLGILPTMVGRDEERAVAPLRSAAGRYLLPHVIPASSWEWRRSHAKIVMGLSSELFEDTSLSTVYRQLALTLIQRLQIQPKDVVPEKPAQERGLLSRLWKLASAGRSKATVESYVKP